jgi:hypothetical protein
VRWGTGVWMSADRRAGVGRPDPVIKVAASTAAQAKAAAQIQWKGVDDCGAPSVVHEYFEDVVGEGFCPVAVGPPSAQREPARGGLRPGRAGSSRVRRPESRHGGRCLWSLHVAAQSVVPARGFAKGGKRSSSSARRFSRSPTSTSDSPRLSVGQRDGGPGCGGAGALSAICQVIRARDGATSEISAADPDVVVAPFGEPPRAVRRPHEPVVIHGHVVVGLRTVGGPGDLLYLPSGRRRLAVRGHVDHAAMRHLEEENPRVPQVLEHRCDVLPTGGPAREGSPISQAPSSANRSPNASGSRRFTASENRAARSRMSASIARRSMVRSKLGFISLAFCVRCPGGWRE